MKTRAEHSEGTCDGITLEEADKSDDYFVCFYHDDGTDRIHWFQLCLCILATTLFTVSTNRLHDFFVKYGQFLDAVMHRNAHPVDYLYQKFKELK